MASRRPHSESKNNAARARLSNSDNAILNNWAGLTRSANPRPAKKDNPEREREATLSRDSTPIAERGARVRTPHTYPRTKEASHMRALEHLRQTLAFNDETSGTDNDDPLEMLSLHSEHSQSPDSGVQDATPDSNQIVGRLMQIRDYLKQAINIKESLEKDSPNSQEQLSRLHKLIQHLKEQEEGYLVLLQKMLTDRCSASALLNNQRELSTVSLSALLNGASSATYDLADDDGNNSEVSLNVDATSEVSECTTQSDKEAEVRALRQQRDLLKKMLDQQRMLKSLHERQAQLLELQRKADGEDMNNHKPSHTPTDEETSIRGDNSQLGGDNSQGLSSTYTAERLTNSLNNSQSSSVYRGHNSYNAPAMRRDDVSDEDKDRDEKEDDEETADENVSDYESDATEASASVGGYAEPPPTEDEPDVPEELQALRSRLLHLKNVFDENHGLLQDDERKVEMLRQMQAAQREMISEGESESSNPDVGVLRRKMENLVENKTRMERLLEELRVLKERRKDKGGACAVADDSSVISTLNGSEAIRETAELTRNAAVTAGQAETVLDVMEQERGIRKLDKLKVRLDRLRGLVQYHDSNALGEAADATSTVDSELTDGQDQDMSLIGNIAAPSKTRKPLALSDSVDDTSDLNSIFSLTEFGDDPEIQEKAKKLNAARERLAALQSLVRMVQQRPESADVLSADLERLGDDLAKLAVNSDTSSDSSTLSKGSTTTASAQSFSERYERNRRIPQTSNINNSSSAQSFNQRFHRHQAPDQKSAAPNQNQTSAQQLTNHQQGANRGEEDLQSLAESATDSRAESEAFYLQRMEDQKLELQKLMAERTKLQTIQNELKTLHSQYTAYSSDGAQGLQSLLRSQVDAAADAESQKRGAGAAGPGDRKRRKRTVSKEKEPGSARATVTFSHQPCNFSVPTYHDELYSRMMEQKMTRQESRKAKGDEDQLTADVTTMATWGDTESSSSSNSVVDEDTPDDEAEIDEDDDGYPSDGIMQVEEEEEAKRDSDRDTYTVEDEYQFRQRYPVNVKPSASTRQRRPHTHTIKEAGNPAAGDYWKPMRSPSGDDAGARGGPPSHSLCIGQITAMRRELDSTSEALMAVMAEQRAAASSSDVNVRLDSINTLCQHLVFQQGNLSSQLQGGAAAAAAAPDNDSIETRVYKSVVSLFYKFVTLEGTYKTFRTIVCSQMLHNELNPDYFVNQNDPRMVAVRKRNVKAAHRLFADDSDNVRTMIDLWQEEGLIRPVECLDMQVAEIECYLPSLCAEADAVIWFYRDGYRRLGASSTDTVEADPISDPNYLIERRPVYTKPVVAPWREVGMESFIEQLHRRVHTLEESFRARLEDINTISSWILSQRGSSALTELAKLHRNPPFKNAGERQTDARRKFTEADTYIIHGSDDRFCYKNEVEEESSASQISRAQAFTEQSCATAVEESARQYYSEHSYSMSIPPLNLDQLIRRRQERSRSLQTDGAGPTYPSPSLSAIAAGRIQVPLDTMYRPGISAGICGTAYADTGSVSSAISSVRGDERSEDTTPRGTPGKESGAGTASSSATATPLQERSRLGRDSAASEYSLFEALRETIYSEVATLISQNENRPHFLIELFRELQMLSSDYLRQRGLYSIQELVTKFLTEDVSSLRQLKSDTGAESDSDVLAPQPAWMLYRTAGSEQTPSESYVTTDEDEVRQMLSTQHSITPVNSSQDFSSLSRLGSIKSDFADYIEKVETMSTQSTSHSQTGSGWEDPFNRDSLGDTVIHLDKAMQKVKDIDRRKEAKREARKDNPNVSMSTDSSSSAQDPGSDNEGSTDMQMTKIDTQKLDRQIKLIMTEIIPVLREHMDNVCSSQLLDYLQQRVILLTVQTGDQPTPEGSAAEFTQFFHKQLFNILKDSMAKFEGRRMRDCGEEILVDISEILFNELAFFKLMQDLNDPAVKERIALSKWRGAGTGPEASGGQGGTDTETSSTVDDNEVISEADADERLTNDGDEGADGGSEDEEGEGSDEEEEEDLGKERDDAFADEVNTADREPTFTDVHYELAPSETKPMTRIGSDEDCSGDEDDTSELSTDDGDDTAISRQTARDQEPIDQSDLTEPLAAGPESEGEAELRVNDLPAKLNVDLGSIAARAAAEQELLAAPTADGLMEVTGELAGSATELKEPPTPSDPSAAAETDPGGTCDEELKVADTDEVKPPPTLKDTEV